MGTEVSRQFIDDGYAVRGTARSQRKVEEWEACNPEYKGKIKCACTHLACLLAVCMLARSPRDFSIGDSPGTIIEDISAPGAFDEAIKGVRYVAHTATPSRCECLAFFKADFIMLMAIVLLPVDNVKDNEKDMLLPAIQGVQNMLDAAKSEPGIEHMVLTSSTSAVFDMERLPHAEKTYSGRDWNPASKYAS